MSSILSWRPRRAGIALALSCGTLAVAGATAAQASAACSSPTSGASGAVCGFSFSPSGTAAGSDPSITATIAFDYGTSLTDSVKNTTITLPPGLQASLGAIQALCTTQQLTEKPASTCPAGSEIGSGSLLASVAGVANSPSLSSNVTLYMMPAPSPSDVAGIGAVVTLLGIPVATTTGTVDVAQAGGSPVLVLSLPSIPNSLPASNGRSLGLQIRQLSFTINATAPTIAGAASTTPFTRLPTSCAPATTTLSVQTWGATSPNGGGSNTFTPTACSGPGAIGFTPSVSALAMKDANDNGVTLITTVNTDPQQAANKSLVLTVPPSTLGADVFNAAALFNKVVGSVTANTPLLSAPLVGTVTLTGTIAQPALTITFPPPVSITFSGGINLQTNAVAFETVPDVPLSGLKVTLTGGPTALFYTNCLQPDGVLSAAFGGQNGASLTATAALNVTGCPPPTVASLTKASIAGVKTSRAKLTFGLVSGDGLPKLASFTISLPGGLSFNKSTFKQGVSVTGAKLRNASLQGGKLHIKLKSPSRSVTVKLSPTALVETKSLATKVKAHKVKSLTATVRATNAAGASITLKVKLKP